MLGWGVLYSLLFPHGVAVSENYSSLLRNRAQGDFDKPAARNSKQELSHIPFCWEVGVRGGEKQQQGQEGCVTGTHGSELCVS